MSTIKCNKCGWENPEDSKFCEKCGNSLGTKNRKKWLIIALAILLLAGAGFWAYKGLSREKEETHETPPTPSKVTIIAVSSNPDFGTVDGGGEYEVGSPVTLMANAKEGCSFVTWKDGEMKKTRTIIAESDKEYVAVFKEKKSGTPNGDVTVDLGWGTYVGPGESGKPNGPNGKVTVKEIYNILQDIPGEKLIVYPGETLVTNYVDGRLRYGEVHHKDGSSELFRVF